ncbi:GntR family transcriptional regulator [Halomonas sp. M20]|uniref:GntR family transcriptional regulator n=1 Tax=Halomonas sp. M20 TaxID=2763264 RepID=UPI001D0BE3D4|nr:GntR family transcriptional regulator [Halomonas sp. M20]
MPPYKTRAQLVADNLRHRILSGEFKGGTQLRQDALASDYEVSRIPVREALLTLESEGLVVFHAHRGAFTTELSVAMIRELFDLRVLLETHLLQHALPNMTLETLDSAEAILLEYDAALDSGSQIDNWSEYNFAFHKTLYAPANLPEAMNLVTQLNTRSDRYIRMQLLYTQAIKKAESEHHALLELSRESNVDEACALLRQHILDACESIVSLLESQGRVKKERPETV